MSAIQIIGEKLRRARLDHGFSIRELAKKTELSPTTISLAEKGADIRISTLVKIASVLELEIRLAVGF